MKIVTIKQGCLGRYDDVSPFLVESGALSLHFALPRVSGEFYLVAQGSFEKGHNQRTVKIPATGDVELDGLLAGELHAEVKHYLYGDLIETFPVEPLIIKNMDGGIRAFPEIGELRAGIEDLKKKLEEGEKRIAERMEALDGAIRKSKTTFLAYAWAEYQSDIQLNGKSLPFEKFIAALGYDPEKLSEEEIKKIKTFKEEL